MSAQFRTARPRPVAPTRNRARAPPAPPRPAGPPPGPSPSRSRATLPPSGSSTRRSAPAAGLTGQFSPAATAELPSRLGRPIRNALVVVAGPRRRPRPGVRRPGHCRHPAQRRRDRDTTSRHERVAVNPIPTTPTSTRAAPPFQGDGQIVLNRPTSPRWNARHAGRDHHESVRRRPALTANRASRMPTFRQRPTGVPRTQAVFGTTAARNRPRAGSVLVLGRRGRSWPPGLFPPPPPRTARRRPTRIHTALGKYRPEPATLDPAFEPPGPGSPSAVTAGRGVQSSQSPSRRTATSSPSQLPRSTAARPPCRRSLVERFGPETGSVRRPVREQGGSTVVPFRAGRSRRWARTLTIQANGGILFAG